MIVVAIRFCDTAAASRGRGTRAESVYNLLAARNTEPGVDQPRRPADGHAGPVLHGAVGSLPDRAVLEYWLNLLLLGAFPFLFRLYAHRAGLDRDSATPAMTTAAYRRVAIAQAMYTVAALPSLWNPPVSIALIFLIHLNYVLAPRIPFLYKI